MSTVVIIDIHIVGFRVRECLIEQLCTGLDDDVSVSLHKDHLQGE